MLSLTSSAVAFGPTAPITRAPVAASRSLAPSMQDNWTTKELPIPFLPRPKMLDGSMAGDIGFDPLRLSEIVPLAWSREAELKHARVCMLAVAGYVSVDLGFRVPFAPEVSSLYAHDAAVENGSFDLLLIVLATIEIFTGIPKCFQLLNDPDAAPPGDFKFDPLGFSASGSPEMKADMAEKELANGRIAMIAFSGIVTQSQLTGGGFPYTYNGAVDMVPPLQAINPIDAIGICSTGIVNGCQ